jgi:hypothetical protein
LRVIGVMGAGKALRDDRLISIAVDSQHLLD